MAMTVKEVKQHEIYQTLTNLFDGVPFTKRLIPLFKTIVIIRNIPVKTRRDLWMATGEVERQCDLFYGKFRYSEYITKEECDFLKCTIDIIREYEKNPFSMKDLKFVIQSFIPQSEF